ncbi:MAG: hypothetical protein ACE5ES_06005 [Candidatus Nanoarchaeia archaeon]
MVDIKNILRRSTPAVCGFTEREVVVPKSKKAAVIRAIKQRGLIFVGTGPVGQNAVKIWFASTPLL